MYVHVCTCMYMYVHVHEQFPALVHTCTCTHVCTRAGKKVQMFEPSFVCCTFEATLGSFAATPTLMFAHVHLYNLNVWLIMWACSRRVDGVLLAASVSFLSPAILNPSRNSDRNKTSTSNNPVLESFYSQSRLEQH